MPFFFVAIAASSFAQEWRINLSGTLKKDWKLAKTWELEASERFYFSPRFESIDPAYDVFFSDIDLLPGTAISETNSGDDDDDDEDEDDDDDDDDDDEDDPNQITGPLNASARRIEAELRSATRIKVEWRAKKWLRLNSGYTLYWQLDRIRHGLATEVRLIPDLPFKKWRSDYRIQLQQVGEQRKDSFRISHGLATRLKIQYELSDHHQLYSGISINADLEETLELDRLRWNVGLRYSFEENHSFDLQYNGQSRLLKKNQLGHGFSFSYTMSL